MSKKVCDFKRQKVAKTLIFTHVIVATQKKSPMAILTGSAVRAIRMIHFTLHSVLVQVCAGKFFPARSIILGLCHTYPCTGLP